MFCNRCDHSTHLLKSSRRGRCRRFTLNLEARFGQVQRVGHRFGDTGGKHRNQIRAPERVRVVVLDRTHLGPRGLLHRGCVPHGLAGATSGSWSYFRNGRCVSWKESRKRIGIRFA